MITKHKPDLKKKTYAFFKNEYGINSTLQY